jgi:valyl-tRNA synthetase
MMELSIFNIENTINAMLEAYTNEETGEINPQINEQLENLEMAKQQKIINITYFHKKLDLFIENTKNEIVKMQAHKAKLEKIQENLINLLKLFVPEGEKIIDRNTNKPIITWRKSPPKIEIIDEYRVMEWCKKNAPQCIKYPEPYLLLSEIKKLIDDNVGIEYIDVTQKNNIQIK